MIRALLIAGGTRRLVVSHEFHFEWHQEQYKGALQDVLITSDELLSKDITSRLQGVKVHAGDRGRGRAGRGGAQPSRGR